MFDFPVPPVDWLAISPIVIVVVTGMLALFVEMIRPKRNNNGVVGVCLLGLVAAAWAVGVNFGQPEGELLAGMAVRDRFGLVFELLILGATFMCLLFSEGYLREKRIPFGEFYPLVLWSAAGGMVMATTRILLVVFLGIEVLSIALYVLAGMSRSEERSEESALKYFLLGAFASGFLLYGIAFVFGATGSLHLGSLAAAWTSGEAPTRAMLVFGLALILIGLGFKNAFVPFHGGCSKGRRCCP
ncbi:MAG: hypothetical protein HY248_01000 [Fimbriimonas ginsengisoli]|nr:hypothetical protein [Fimbriimonas ginsengisoli]